MSIPNSLILRRLCQKVLTTFVSDWALAAVSLLLIESPESDENMMHENINIHASPKLFIEVFQF